MLTAEAVAGENRREVRHTAVFDDGDLIHQYRDAGARPPRLAAYWDGAVRFGRAGAQEQRRRAFPSKSSAGPGLRAGNQPPGFTLISLK